MKPSYCKDPHFLILSIMICASGISFQALAQAQVQTVPAATTGTYYQGQQQIPNQPISTSPTMAPLDSSAYPLPGQTLTRPVPGVDNSDIPLNGQSLSNPYRPEAAPTSTPGTSGYMVIKPGSLPANNQIPAGSANPAQQLPVQR